MEMQSPPPCNALWVTPKKLSVKQPCPLKHLFPPMPQFPLWKVQPLGSERYPAVLAAAGEALASRWEARLPLNRLPLVRRGRPVALTLRRGAGNKGGCVRPSHPLARRPDTHSCHGQGFPGCPHWDARGMCW